VGESELSSPLAHGERQTVEGIEFGTFSIQSLDLTGSPSAIFFGVSKFVVDPVNGRIFLSVFLSVSIVGFFHILGELEKDIPFRANWKVLIKFVFPAPVPHTHPNLIKPTFTLAVIFLLLHTNDQNPANLTPKSWQKKGRRTGFCGQDLYGFILSDNPGACKP